MRYPAWRMDYSATAEDPLSLAENLCHNLHPVELYQSGVFQKLSGECRVPSLFVIQGRNKGTRYDLAAFEGATSIGRDSVNSIQLQDNEVSRSHAEIRLVGETVVLSDLKSSNGTYLNNRKVERAELASGDQIQIGRTVLVFSKDLENSFVPPPISITTWGLTELASFINSEKSIIRFNSI